jgi:hypothetical protein
MTISGDLIRTADEDSKFLNNLITADETWCFLYDPQKQGSFLNGNYHRHHHQLHHFVEKNLELVGVEGRKCYVLKGFLPTPLSGAWSIMCSSLKVKP